MVSQQKTELLRGEDDGSGLPAPTAEATVGPGMGQRAAEGEPYVRSTSTFPIAGVSEGRKLLDILKRHRHFRWCPGAYKG